MADTLTYDSAPRSVVVAGRLASTLPSLRRLTKTWLLPVSTPQRCAP
jgi:hypothetical protein